MTFTAGGSQGPPARGGSHASGIRSSAPHSSRPRCRDSHAARLQIGTRVPGNRLAESEHFEGSGSTEWRNRKMRDNDKIRNLLCGTLPAIGLAALIAGCAQTAAPAPSIVQRVEREKPPPPAPTGFLGADYSLLKPGAEGSGQQAMLAYVSSSANFSSYDKIM